MALPRRTCENRGCAQQAERSLQDEEALEERETVVVLHEPEAMVIPEVCFSTEAQRDLGRMFTHHSLSVFPVPPHPEVSSVS